MNRVTIALVGLVIAASVGVVAWMVTPPQWAKYQEFQACQTVYDQMRREIETPAEAKFPDCENALILPGEDGGWIVHGEYEIPRPDFTNPYRYMFYGNAWRSSDGWEATIVATTRVLP